MDETTRAAALELNAAGMTQREAAAALGLSRASYRRAIGAASVNARANGSLHAGPVRTSRNRAEALDALGIVPEDMEGLTADDLDTEAGAEPEPGELPTTASAARVIAIAGAVVLLGALVLWWWRRRQAESAGQLEPEPEPAGRRPFRAVALAPDPNATAVPVVEPKPEPVPESLEHVEAEPGAVEPESLEHVEAEPVTLTAEPEPGHDHGLEDVDSRADSQGH